MILICKWIVECFVLVQQGVVLLIIFNEVDMFGVMEMCKCYKESFFDCYGVKFGFMSFFVKVMIDVLCQFLCINVKIEGDEIVYYNYFDIGVVVIIDCGLMVFVLCNVEVMSFVEVENVIIDYGMCVCFGKIKFEEFEGGIFIILNGGIFGLMFLMLIINLLQSGVFGMYNIVECFVVVNGEVVICLVMYLVFFYDYCIVDGCEVVIFLCCIKEVIEDLLCMLFEV